MTQLARLRTKLCRELAQSERSAMVHGRREARRLGASPPADALNAIAEHAEGQRPRFAHLIARRDQMIGVWVERAVGAAISALRHAFVDRLFDSERSYRATLLGLKHGLDIARLLRDVAVHEHDMPLVRFCDELLLERQCLIERAEQALAWFAERPELALASGLRLPFGSPPSLPDVVASP